MLKTGICSLKDFVHGRSLLGRRRRVSLDVLQAVTPGSPEADQVFSEVMGLLRLSNGTYRTTTRRRFSMVDQGINRILADVVDWSADVSIHDWATSDGSAALEWACSLRTMGDQLRFCASDRILSVIKAYRNGSESYFFEPDGAPIEYTRAPFVISLQEPESAAYPVNRFLARRAHRKLPALSAVVPTLSWPSVSDATIRHRDGWCFSQRPLLHPSVLDFALRNRWFSFARHSIFDALGEPANVIRTMNILNLAYFSSDELVRGINACYASLAPGGIWVIGKSQADDGANTNADLFQRNDDGFSMIASIGEGSQIRHLVMGFRSRTQ